jgi:hypothetical protein
MTKLKIFSLFLIVLLAVSLTVCFLPQVKATSICFARTVYSGCTVQINDLTASTSSVIGQTESLAYTIGDNIEFVAYAGSGTIFTNWNSVSGSVITDVSSSATYDIGIPASFTDYYAIFTLINGSPAPISTPSYTAKFTGMFYDTIIIRDLTTETSSTATSTDDITLPSTTLLFNAGDDLEFIEEVNVAMSIFDHFNYQYGYININYYDAPVLLINDIPSTIFVVTYGSGITQPIPTPISTTVPNQVFNFHLTLKEIAILTMIGIFALIFGCGGIGALVMKSAFGGLVGINIGVILGYAIPLGYGYNFVPLYGVIIIVIIDAVYTTISFRGSTEGK